MDITQQLALISKKMGLTFTLRNKALEAEEVFGTAGVLPAIMRRADQLSSFCLGKGLGVQFGEVTQGTMGVQIQFDNTAPQSLRLLCAVEILQELVDSSPNKQQIALDDLLYD